MSLYKTVIQLEVLSEDPPCLDLQGDFSSLESISRACYDGDYSGKLTVISQTKLNKAQAIQACKEQGTDPDFFSLKEPK